MTSPSRAHPINRMQLSHVTLRDPDLPHQVVLYNESGNGHTNVSCNCRAIHLANGEVHYDSMGRTLNIEMSRVLYNDPANHRISFTEEDKAKW